MTARPSSQAHSCAAANDGAPPLVGSYYGAQSRAGCNSWSSCSALTSRRCRPRRTGEGPKGEALRSLPLLCGSVHLPLSCIHSTSSIPLIHRRSEHLGSWARPGAEGKGSTKGATRDIGHTYPLPSTSKLATETFTVPIPRVSLIRARQGTQDQPAPEVSKGAFRPARLLLRSHAVHTGSVKYLQL